MARLPFAICAFALCANDKEKEKSQWYGYDTRFECDTNALAACASVFRSSGKRARQIYFIIAFYRVEYVFCGMAHVLCESVK